MRALLILSLFWLSCGRIELDYYSIQESSSSLEPVYGVDSEGIRRDVLHTMSHQNNFEDVFTSSELDMVFILDTNKKAESFYSKDFLGYDFLNRFYDYDWKLAWTDMFIDQDALKKEAEQKESSDSSCQFFPKLITTLVGAYSGAPGLTELGLKGIFDCIPDSQSRNQRDEQKNQYANGSFLAFEHNQPTYVLSKRNRHSSGILSKSLLLPNPKEEPYKAPLLRENRSFPLLSMLFSLSKNLYAERFFREDSLIVFVMFSFSDSAISLSSDSFKQSLKSALGRTDRFKWILVTLTEDSLLCPLAQDHSSHKMTKLIRFANNLDQPVLNICSQTLGEDIFKEISKGLSTPL